MFQNNSRIMVQILLKMWFSYNPLPADQILVQKKMLPVSLNIKVQINCPIY
jgi:hypothetical protein